MSIRIITAMFAIAAAVTLSPTAQADTHSGVGHSGKGQTHQSVSDSRPVPPDFVKHFWETINQLLHQH